VNKYLKSYAEEWYSLVNKSDLSFVDREIVDVLLLKHHIVGATCVGFANKRIGMDRNVFDVTIIDEAARSTPPEI